MMEIDRERFWRLLRAIAAASAATQAAACVDVLDIEPAARVAPERDGGPLDAGDASLPPDGGEARAVCGDVSSDPQHCGACGHACDGATCRDGRCAPVVVAAGQRNAYRLTINGDELFWATGWLMHCPKADCFGGPKRSLCSPTNEGGIFGFAVRSSPNVVAAAQGGVAALCPWTEGTTSVLLAQDRALFGAVQPAYLADDLLLARVEMGPPAGQPVLVRCTPPLCTAPKLVARDIIPTAIAADRSAAVFATRRSQGVADLQRLSVDGVTSLVAAEQPTPTTIVLGPNHVAWVTGTPGAPAMACALPSCAGGPRAIGNHAWVDSVAVDETDAYYIDFATRTVHRCAIAACEATDTTIAASQNGATSIAVDRTHVYWSNAGDSTIVKLRKPPR